MSVLKKFFTIKCKNCGSRDISIDQYPSEYGELIHTDFECNYCDQRWICEQSEGEKGKSIDKTPKQV